MLLEPFGNPILVGTLVTAIVALYFLFVISRAIQDFLQNVIVPRTKADPNVVNAALTSAGTTYTKTDRVVRIKIPVGVSYSSDPDEVHEILLAVARQDPMVQEEPEPVVRFTGFGDSSLDFRLDVWIDDPMLMLSIKSDLHFMIWKAFAEHNIVIPFPQRDLHLRSGVPWEKIDVNSRAETIAPEMNTVRTASPTPS